MNLNGIDLNLLVALDALLETQNVTRAGEMLYVSQSAMSGSLSRLRECFEDPLLVPLGGKLKRTALAEELRQPVRALLTQTKALFERRPSFVPEASSRVFRVMASDYGSVAVVSELLRCITRSAPRVGVEVIPFSDCPAQSLEAGDIDALIIAKPYLSPAHPFKLLFEDTFSCVVWTGNADIDGQIALVQFESLGHVVVKYGKHGIAHIEEKFFQTAGISRRVEVVVSSFSSVPQFIIGTDRVAMMHTRLALSYAKSMPLKVLPPPLRMPLVEECLQWHVSREHDPGNAWFKKQALSTLSTRPSDLALSVC
jgi:LysR family transcriptional regulator, nod-box dependent transcriptional activator